MKLLLDERKLIVAIGNTIEYGMWGNAGALSSWKITDTHYIMDGNYYVEDIGDTEIPTYVNAGEYYYIDGKFKLKDECPNEYKDRVKYLEEALAITDETAIELYEAQAAQEEVNSAQDDAIIELYELLSN